MTDDRFRPTSDAVRRREHVVGSGEAGNGLARLEIVITVFEPKNLDGFRELVVRDFLSRAKEVACPLHDKSRRPHFGEMRGAQLIRFTYRMERIAETQQPGYTTGSVELDGDHTCDAAAHRLPADDECPFRPQRVNCGDVFGFERFGARRRLLSR